MPNPGKINWPAIDYLLGTVPDVVLARRLHIDPSAVVYRRQKLGRPRHRANWETLAGELARFSAAQEDIDRAISAAIKGGG